MFTANQKLEVTVKCKTSMGSIGRGWCLGEGLLITAPQKQAHGQGRPTENMLSNPETSTAEKIPQVDVIDNFIGNPASPASSGPLQMTALSAFYLVHTKPTRQRLPDKSYKTNVANKVTRHKLQDKVTRQK